MTVRRSGGLTWVAARDGIAHARLDRDRSGRTLCDRPATPERYAWPASERCATCVQRAKEAATA